MPEHVIHVQEEDLHLLKRRIGLALPETKHANAVEILAMALGFKSNAALREAIKTHATIYADADTDATAEILRSEITRLHGGDDIELDLDEAVIAISSALWPFSNVGIPDPETETDRIAALIEGPREMPIEAFAKGLAAIASSGESGEPAPIVEPRHRQLEFDARVHKGTHPKAPELDILEITVKAGRGAAQEGLDQETLDVVKYLERFAMARDMAIVFAMGEEALRTSACSPLIDKLANGILGRGDEYKDVSRGWGSAKALIAKHPSDRYVIAWRPSADAGGPVGKVIDKLFPPKSNVTDNYFDHGARDLGRILCRIMITKMRAEGRSPKEASVRKLASWSKQALDGWEEIEGAVVDQIIGKDAIADEDRVSLTAFFSRPDNEIAGIVKAYQHALKLAF